MLIAFLSVLLLLKNTFSFYFNKKEQQHHPENSSKNQEVTKPIDNKMSNFLTKSSSDILSSNVIVFKSGDKQHCYEINEPNVTIVGSAGSHDHGSSKVKLKNIVDYKWETKNYPGHLIAVHIDGKHIAYVINVNNKISRTEGMVRVVNATSGLRALIKGMSGEVLDLQFAHIENERILASIDACSLYVHKIDMISETLVCNLLIKIEDPLTNYTPKYDKISWCPYVDCSSDDDEESNQLIVWARGSIYQCFNVNTINVNYGQIGKFCPTDIATGYLKFYEPTLVITWVALSPDGTTLGVGGEDGIIRFYQIWSQVYFHEKEPRCLHQWKPHGGKPISSFFFLDNLTKTSSDSYWKYALTGADDNTEFKIWDCGSWECLQTINIKTSEDKKLKFIAEIDRTSSYLVISNLDTRVMYVLQIITAPDGTPSLDMNATTTGGGVVGSANNSIIVTNNDQVKKKTFGVCVKSVSEFPLSSPILSFSIVDAAVRRYKCANDNYLVDEMDDYDEETNSIYCVVVRMFIVQPKSVQECHILYQPTVDENTDVKSSISNDSTKEFIENSSEKSNDKDLDNVAVQQAISVGGGGGGVVKSEKGPLEALFDRVSSSSTAQANVVGVDKTDSPNPSPHLSTSSHKSFTQVNLMTPDAFSSSSTGKKSPEIVSSEVLNTILMLASVTGSNTSANKPDNMNLLNLRNNKIIEDQEQQKIKQSMETHKKFMAIENSSNRNNIDNLTSGNSSPSREVQEIMSLQDYDCRKSSYSGDETDQGKPKNGPSTKIINKLPENQNETEKKIPPPTATIMTSIWPKVPDVRTVKKHSTELQNSENLITTSEPNNDLSDINMKMSKILDLVQKQSVQIKVLQNEITELKEGNIQNSFKDMKDFSFKVEMQLSKLMESYLKRYENEHKKKLSAFLAGREAQNRELRDTFVQLINQFTLTRLTEVISKVITIEIQRQIMPMLSAKIDGLQQQIQMDVANKLAAFDMMLKDNIAHVCKSKNIIDAFGKSVLVGVQGSLQSAFVESMSSTLIPAYEKSSQNMFKQLHEAFSVGIKEFMEQFDNYLSHLQPMQDSTEEILNKFSGFRQHLDSILIKHRNTVQESMLDTKKDVKHMEIMLTRQIAEVVRSEVRKGFESQTAALRSQATTPAPSIYDIKDQIKLLLSTGQINKAFHQALLANDLSLVEFTLQRADHNAVFHPCCLEQKVLLSLIQQISADMSNHNEVKQNYLADAILSINPNDPITREHAPKVMQELYRNCQAFLLTQTKNPQCSNVRMLMKAIQGLSTEKSY
ncbi:enhancer of mRNA-decapping protein 4 homolog isoform X4 [Eupeodes corollae]|uniref:enhancer of mRNA-decapping protein 4 homolog isoform X4 n=1 Tax=Eupeodes corollae TaxID=290404 RepID=UPI002493705A|nr:enhancer of mRNA-decapping protein 4 homolog isoform X4 [Eupeodes corollae]